MDDDEQGASRKAALRYTGPRSGGKEESFIEAKQQLENALGSMAMALLRNQVSFPRDSDVHSGLSVNDARAFVDGVTLIDQDGNEIVANHAELEAAREFLKTKTVNGDVTRAAGSMHGTSRRSMQVVDAARAAAEQRREGKALVARARRRDERCAKASTLGPSSDSSPSGCWGRCLPTRPGPTLSSGGVAMRPPSSAPFAKSSPRRSSWPHFARRWST